MAFSHPSPATVLAHPVSTISGTLDGVRCSCTVHHVVHNDVGVAHTSPVPLKVVPVMLPIGLFATKSAQVAKSLTEQSVGNVVASVFVSLRALQPQPSTGDSDQTIATGPTHRSVLRQRAYAEPRLRMSSIRAARQRRTLRPQNAMGHFEADCTTGGNDAISVL